MSLADFLTYRFCIQLLEANGIETPKHVYLNRDEVNDPDDTQNVVEEFDEYIVVNGVRMNKPVVEKPVDADDHNIYIYYPTSAGGGSKRLFRKVNDRSSAFYPKVNELRRKGSYIYEEFLITQGTDVKVYTVGPNYGHAEARKSPVVDGKVNRDNAGLEVRYPVILSPQEKEISRKITLAFKQTVCGFDILRVHGKSYVCDVNGFSFVKNSRKYYDDCSQILLEIMLTKLRPEYHAKLSTVQPLLRTTTKSSGLVKKPASSNSSGGGSTMAGTSSPSTIPNSSSTGNPGEGNETIDISTTNNFTSAVYDEEELRCVIAVFRHGDRTPKQKIKLKIKEEEYLEYFHRYSSPKKDLKVKSKSALVEFLDITRKKVAEEERKRSKSNEDQLRKLRQIKDVLERWEISGINRKLQMKPLSWVNIDPPVAVEGSATVAPSDEKAEIAPAPLESDAEAATAAVTNSETPTVEKEPSVREGASTPVEKSDIAEHGIYPFLPQPQRSGQSDTCRATELLLILKWGGDLTPLGRDQAIQLGADFRDTMYPHPSGGGVLRLHSTFRHDLKIKASDEGRVMKTAAAFTKGLLELEGNLTPVLVSLVQVEEKNSQMLDHCGNSEIKVLMDMCKSHMDRVMQLDREMTPEMFEEIAPAKMLSVHESLSKIRNPKKTLEYMHELLGRLCDEIRYCCELSRQAEDACDFSMIAPSVVSEDPTPTENGASSQQSAMAESLHSSMDPENSTVLEGESELKRVISYEKKMSLAMKNSEVGSPRECQDTDSDSNAIPIPELYLRETFELMLTRWEKLHKDFYNKATDHFDLTKVPDVYDMARYDVFHNQISLLPSLDPLFEVSRYFADAVVPQEYGIGIKLKRFIGAKMCHALLEKILRDLSVAKSDSQMDMTYLLDMSHAEDMNIRTLGRCVRTRLYFTSESHLHTLLNVLRYPLEGEPKLISDEGCDIIAETSELSYLTHVVIRLFERRGRELDDPKRFRCEISFSPGAILDPRVTKTSDIAPTRIINNSLVCDELIHALNSALSASDLQQVDSESAEASDASEDPARRWENSILGLKTLPINPEKPHGFPPRNPSFGGSSNPPVDSPTAFSNPQKMQLTSPDECTDNWEAAQPELRSPGKKSKIRKGRSAGAPGASHLKTIATGNSSFHHVSPRSEDVTMDDRGSFVSDIGSTHLASHTESSTVATSVASVPDAAETSVSINQAVTEAD
jgi:inositol hexakisphosphate/diphosphoinositol-pentakisphosphate kinase